MNREQRGIIQLLFNISFRLRWRKGLIIDVSHFFYVSQHYFQRSPFRLQSYNTDSFLLNFSSANWVTPLQTLCVAQVCQKHVRKWSQKTLYEFCSRKFVQNQISLCATDAFWPSSVLSLFCSLIKRSHDLYITTHIRFLDTLRYLAHIFTYRACGDDCFFTYSFKAAHITVLPLCIQKVNYYLYYRPTGKSVKKSYFQVK